MVRLGPKDRLGAIALVGPAAEVQDRRARNFAHDPEKRKPVSEKIMLQDDG
jgi:hypothetical protein